MDQQGPKYYVKTGQAILAFAIMLAGFYIMIKINSPEALVISIFIIILGGIVGMKSRIPL